MQPPDDARPMVRWWWFGPAVVQPELQREMESMKAGGFGGFEAQPTYPLAVDNSKAGIINQKFMSPEFLDDLKFVAAKAKDLGLRMDLTLGSGWPYGGPVISIKEASGALRIAKAQSPAGQSSVPTPALREGESLIGAYVGQDGSAFQELVVRDNAAQIPADVPRPAQVLFYIAGHTGMKVKRPAFGAEGPVMDHQSLAASEKFIDSVGKKEIEACAPNPPHSIFCDSLEVYGEDWTPNLLAEFQKRRGYDLKPLLPALTNDIGPGTLDIRHDWGQTLTEVFNDNFVAPFHRLAQDEKTQFRIQAYGNPSAGLYSYAGSDLPEGEGYQWHGYRATRYASSACHLMGVPVTSSETFTWLHNLVFRATPLDVKAEADLHFLQGVNQIICHGWPYTPPGIADPGWSFYAAGVFDERNPWYTVMPDVTRYIQRISFMMRQGKPANDIAVYLANSDAWAQFKPGHVSLSDGVGAALGPQIVGQILDSGYNLDFFDDPMLDRFGKVEGGKLAFGDLRYRVIVLAGVERIPVSTMRKLETFARDGGILIATRRQPALAPGYRATDAEQKEVGDISQRLFKGPNAPALFVEDESQFAAALASRLRPDAAFSPAAPQIGVVHRHTNDADIYFLANTSNKPVETQATFRVEGLQPQWWNPVTGKVTMGTATNSPSGGTVVGVSLDAYESTMLIFTHDSPPATQVVHQGDAPAPLDLSTGWTVQFGKDAKPVQMDKLASWTDDASTRNFSGVATYARHVSVPAAILGDNANLSLTFGPSAPSAGSQGGGRGGTGFQADLDPPVRDAAVVSINGHPAGSVWCPPYRLDVGKFLTAGDNEIQIEVANTEVNSISAHGFPNYDNEAIIAQFGTRFDAPRAELFQPVPSGLLGPIQLTSAPTVP